MSSAERAVLLFHNPGYLPISFDMKAYDSDFRSWVVRTQIPTNICPIYR
jgi:hypothetical protein